MAVVAGVAALATALAIWVVPAFSGGTAGEWTWVSGQVLSDDDPGSSGIAAYNGSSDPQQVTVRALNADGSTAPPTVAATVTVAPGTTATWPWNCASAGGCSRVYEVHTQSPDVVPSLVYDEPGTAGVGPFTGLVPAGGFQVFGPNQSSAEATTQAISAATAALQAQVTQLQDKTAALDDKTAALQNDTTQLKADTAALQNGNAAVKTDTARLRKDSKKLKKQLKKLLKAVR